MRSYSQIFSCLHDEIEPVGNIGRGSHYSVFRVPEWRDVSGTPMQVGQIHDFAVIWDEDHDERVIAVAERLYVNGLFFPVQFIGERKGMLTVIVAATFRWSSTQSKWDSWSDHVTRLCEDIAGDYWTANFGSFDKSIASPQQTDPAGVINDREDKSIIYLRNIDNLWNLGTRAFQDRLGIPSTVNPPVPFSSPEPRPAP